jgi:predicted DNA-binding transcriptional regulator YafY
MRRSPGSTCWHRHRPHEHDIFWQESRYRGGVRASRLVSLLLLLQTRGQLTAGELAQELEVSERTVHRDVEALSASGVPIYAERGAHGGIRLVDGYRTRLTGMTGDEAEALFLAGLPGPAAELGLGTVVAAAQLKVLASLPPELRARASRLVERFHLDAGEWFHANEAVPYLAPLSDAVWNATRIAIDYERGSGPARRDIEPLGLVLKAGIWYVVAGTDGGQIRTYRISRVAAGRLRPRRLLGRCRRSLRARGAAHRCRRAGAAGSTGPAALGRRPRHG